MAGCPPTWVYEKEHMTEAYLPRFDLLSRFVHPFADDMLCCASTWYPKLDVTDAKKLR